MRVKAQAGKRCRLGCKAVRNGNGINTALPSRQSAGLLRSAMPLTASCDLGPNTHPPDHSAPFTSMRGKRSDLRYLPQYWCALYLHRVEDRTSS